ncbi:GAF domain-containing protein, partial [bacterium]|nr:GAF domain-containing protein [bacterium]
MKIPLSSVNENVIRELRERVKELNCIYTISSIALNDGAPLDQIIQDIAERVPFGFQHPESTCAQVIVADRRTITGNFRTSPWRLEAGIPVNGEIAGKLEVGYIGALPGPDPPFLEEEKELVESIANHIGAVLHFKVLQDSLERSETKY